METRERYIRWKVTLQVFSEDVWPQALLFLLKCSSRSEKSIELW
jgi:hypothetical protein